MIRDWDKMAEVLKQVISRSVRAMEELWEIGDDALVVLETSDRNPEVPRGLACSFAKETGNHSETPEKLVLLIENYWSGSPREKISIQTTQNPGRI